MLSRIFAQDVTKDDTKYFSTMGKFMLLVGTTHPFSQLPTALTMSLVHGAILNKTYCLYLEDDKPVGGLIWALLNEEMADHYLEHGVLPSVKAWRSGNQLWFLNVVAERGLVHKVMDEAKNELFSEHICGYMLRRSPGGQRRIVEMSRSGARVVRKLRD